jgi:hypothetical protein
MTKEHRVDGLGTIVSGVRGLVNTGSARSINIESAHALSSIGGLDAQQLAHLIG